MNNNKRIKACFTKLSYKNINYKWLTIKKELFYIIKLIFSISLMRFVAIIKTGIIIL